MRTLHKVWAAALLAAPLVLGSVTASEAANSRGYGDGYGNQYGYSGKYAKRDHDRRWQPSWHRNRYYVERPRYRFWRFGNFQRRHYHRYGY